MDKIKISVVVPVYNVEPYLEKCVNSVLGQSFYDYELLLIDDGSTDNSPALCDMLAQRDQRIRVIHQQNQGPAATRNRGAAQARGECLIFLDSDDYWDAEVLSVLWETMEASGADMVMFPIVYEDAEEKPLPTPFFPPAGRYTGDDMLAFLCENCVQMVTPVNRLTRSALWQTLRFPTGRSYEDEFLAHRWMAACRQVAVVDGPFYHYLQRGGSVTKLVEPERLLDRADAFLDRAEFLSARGDEALLRLTVKSAVHWFLVTLQAVPYARLKRCPHWADHLARFQRGLKNGTWRNALTKKEMAAVKHPVLWQSLHRLRHGNKEQI